jgi:hypothetical protein
MTSQGHHFTPESLPSDYAMLSGHAATAAQNESHDDDDEMTDDFQEYPRPRNPIMSSSHRKQSVVSYGERTPLLGNPVPRIHEQVQTNGSSIWFAEYLEELKILTKNTIPVYG